MSKMYTNEELKNIEESIIKNADKILTYGAYDSWQVVIKTLIEQARAYNISTEKPNIFRGAVNDWDDGSC